MNVDAALHPAAVRSSPFRPEWGDARRLLCVRLDSLGDVLMTTPALRALKCSREGRHLTLLTSPAGAEAAALIPEIDEVLVYEAPWMKPTLPRTSSRPDFETIEGLRRARFDGAVLFTVFSQNPLPAALVCYLAEIPLRLAHCRENPYQLLTDWVVEREPERGVRHEVRRQLDLVQAAGARTTDEHLSLAVPDESRSQMRRLLVERGIDTDGPWVLIHPGASAASRRYAPNDFATVARGLVRDRGLPVVFAGGAAESALVEQIRSMAGESTVSFTGCLSLAELSALIALAPVLIANNSAPCHIAAAVSTPVVVLYALTNPQHTPWAVRSRVLSYDVPCRNCFKSDCPEQHHLCLRGVAPEAVVTAALELLAEGRS